MKLTIYCGEYCSRVKNKKRRKMSNTKDNFNDKKEIEEIIGDITNLLRENICQFCPADDYTKKKQKGEIGKIYGKTLILK